MGAGVGPLLSTVASAAVLAVAAERLTTGIAAATAFRQIGAALAIAVWVAICGNASHSGVLEGFDRGYAYMAAGSLAVLTFLRSRSAPAGGSAPAAGRRPGTTMIGQEQ